MLGAVQSTNLIIVMPFATNYGFKYQNTMFKYHLNYLLYTMDLKI